jgi:hypothetical protein
MTVRWEDINTVLSNVTFLIPAATAYTLYLYVRALIYFLMFVASSLYHLCDAFNVCLFPFSFHHHLDFFFAQFLIVLSGAYIIYFPPKYRYLEYWVLILGAVGVVILEVLLPSSLIVQAGIVTFVFVATVLYWLICYWLSKYRPNYYRTHYAQLQGKMPKYNMAYLCTGLALTAGSIMLFTVQNIWYKEYWLPHSVWHIAAALGQHYILLIKDPQLSQNKYMPAARSVYR